MDFPAGREIGDHKPVQLAESRQHPFRRAVRICVERKWTRTIGEFDRTHVLFGLLIDDCNRKRPIIRSGDDVFPVGRDVCVVDLHSVQRESFCICQRRCVDDVHAKGLSVDGLIQSASILTDRNVVGRSTERNLFEHFERPRIDHVHCAIGFIGNVQPASIGCRRHAVIRFNAGNLTHHSIGSRINNVDVIAGHVGLNDAKLQARSGSVVIMLRQRLVGECCLTDRVFSQDPCRDRLPLWLVCRGELRASTMPLVAAGFVPQRVNEKRACKRIAGNHLLADRIEVLA